MPFKTISPLCGPFFVAMTTKLADQDSLVMLTLVIYANNIFTKLIFSILWANSTDAILICFFLFFPEKRIWHFMHIVPEAEDILKYFH